MLDKGSQIDSVYFDMSKVFDKVRHDLLEHAQHAQQEAGFGGNVPRQRVATSSKLPVTSVVSQGSILGPALFLIYGNNRSNVVTDSEVAMFADDTKI